MRHITQIPNENREKSKLHEYVSKMAKFTLIIQHREKSKLYEYVSKMAKFTLFIPCSICILRVQSALILQLRHRFSSVSVVWDSKSYFFVQEYIFQARR